jgi:hypothetical protein
MYALSSHWQIYATKKVTVPERNRTGLSMTNAIPRVLLNDRFPLAAA